MYEKFQDGFSNCVVYGDAGQCELVYIISTADVLDHWFYVSIITYLKAKIRLKLKKEN